MKSSDKRSFNSRRLTACGSAICAMLLIGASAPQKQLDIENHSMETIDPERQLPEGYFPLGNGVILVDDRIAADGDRSVKMVLRGEHEYIALARGIVDPAITPGCKYKITVKVRTHDLHGQIMLRAYEYPPRLKMTEIKPDLTGTNDWTTLELPVVARDDYASTQVRMVVVGTGGRVWFDDLRMVVVEEK